uniref:Uncharacterized protein n=1 Tax=Daphnia magna TaxID=35525 RepID=A0A0N8E756_9CRUS
MKADIKIHSYPSAHNDFVCLTAKKDPLYKRVERKGIDWISWSFDLTAALSAGEAILLRNFQDNFNSLL